MDALAVCRCTRTAKSGTCSETRQRLNSVVATCRLLCVGRDDYLAADGATDPTGCLLGSVDQGWLRRLRLLTCPDLPEVCWTGPVSDT